MSTMSTWDEDRVLTLIEHYKSMRIIWDPTHKDYYKKQLKEYAWAEIGSVMGTTGEICKKKMNIILASWRREKAKEKPKNRGAGKGRVYESKWFAYSALDFLKERESPQKGKTKKVIKTEPSTDSFTIEVHDPLDVHAPIDVRPEPLPQPSKRRRNESSDDKTSNEILLDAYAVLKKSSSTALPDHYESFGNHVATELRKYDAQTLPYVKKAILDILFQADIGKFTPDGDDMC